MQRRGPSGRQVKGRRASTRKTRKAPAASASADQSVEQFDGLRRERDQAREQQAATADILRVIRTSPGDVQPVFDTIVRNAVFLCGGLFANVFRFDGELLHYVASHNVGPSYADTLRTKYPMRPDSSQVSGRVVLTKSVIWLEDALTDPDYNQRFPVAMGWRRLLGVPMLREGDPIGVIGVGWAEPGPPSMVQEELLKIFADQAVIAIENARLLNELREALEQQTATSEVLKVISGSPGELEPVFNAMLENATRICEAKFGALYRFDGNEFHLGALLGAPPAFSEFQQQRGAFKPPPGTPLDRLLRTKEVIRTADDSAAEIPTPSARLAGAKSHIAVPMFKDDELAGAIVIYRQEVRPFTDKQVELVQNFAAQAVIAIENARLLNDLNNLNQQLEQRVTDQVSEIERMGRLRRFLPPQVADLIVASGTEKQLESHRREITALFCDLRGFTGFSESSDPEDVMALLREYHAAIGEIINKYGGTLERYAGDGVMVVFNDPILVDNPALQAVRTAIDMRAAIGALIEKWRKLGHDIGFGIGIAHGFATLGTIGFEGRFDYSAIGTVSNVASRLCDEAKPGQILISPRVLMAIEKDITVESVGDFALKGIRRPLTAYNVLATKAAN